MIAGDAVAARLRDGHAAKDISTADDEADFDAKLDGLSDFAGDPVDDFLIDAERLITQKRFAGNLEEHTSKTDRFRHTSFLFTL
ncbi:hypothetical protein K32_22990 [Kaistia sp. 32K]|nr:hypothetical protein K32_22990 [Kaistia sp. 32K]